MADKWSAASRGLAQDVDYLDRLYAVYNGDGADTAPVAAEAWTAFKAAYAKKDKSEVVRLLVSSRRRFPVPLPYVPFLRNAMVKDPTVLARNPKTVDRLGSVVLNMKLEAISEAITAPAKASQRMGQAFKTWVRTQPLGLSHQSLAEFQGSKKDALLVGTDADAANFAKDYLGFRPRGTVKITGLDLLARVGKKYIVGEAKWLTDFGGSQINQFNQAMHVVDAATGGSVWRLAILDGVVWLPRNTKMQKGVAAREDGDQRAILSALLLPEFVKSLRR